MIEIIAHNYGADHANAIHNDAGAQQHGYAGALVPGVAVYGYLVRPVVQALGLDWLARGAASVKFIQPVYHGDIVHAHAEPTSPMQLSLRNAARQLCATGTASLPATKPTFVSGRYPRQALPATLHPPTLAAFRAGDVLGAHEFTLNWQAERDAFLAAMNDPTPLYRGTPAIVHPAFWLARANEVLMRNIALGMWIHTASAIRHASLAREGEALSVRGYVADLYEKRGNEYVVADLVVFGASDRLIAHIQHTAIIRLRESTASN
jgi:acyl dehydratase